MTKLLNLSAIVLLLAIFSSCNQKPTESTEKQAITETPKEEVVVKNEGPITAAKDGKVQAITSDQFAKQVNDFRTSPKYALKADLPCVVDFYADWCKPCKMIAPFMEEFANQYKGKINFLKINVDEQPEIANFYQIQAIPMMMFCPKKGDMKTEVGGADKEEINRRIQKYILNKN